MECKQCKIYKEQLQEIDNMIDSLLDLEIISIYSIKHFKRLRNEHITKEEECE